MLKSPVSKGYFSKRALTLEKSYVFFSQKFDYNNLLIILDQLIKFQVEKPLANILFVIYLTYKNAMFKIFKVQYMYIIHISKKKCTLTSSADQVSSL